MRILVEHVLFSPYDGVIYGGAEKSCQTMLKVLQEAGHTVDLAASQDSTLQCIKAPIYSGRYVAKHGGVMKLKQWYHFLREIAQDYDAVVLNHGLTSQSILDPAMAEFLSKCAYINRDASGWYVQGAGGMRALSNLRWLRYNGGKAYYMSSANKEQLDWVWNHPKKGPEVRGQCAAGGVKRIGHTKFFALDAFDGFYHQGVCPANIQPPRAAEGYAITVARPVPWKRLAACAKEARRLGLPHVVCATTDNGTETEVGLSIIQKLRDIGSTVLLDLPHDEIMHHVAGADVMVHLAPGETFCNSIWEANAHGVPTIGDAPALQDFPELRGGHTTLTQRAKAQQKMRTYTSAALAKRIEQLLPTFTGELE